MEKEAPVENFLESRAHFTNQIQQYTKRIRPHYQVCFVQKHMVGFIWKIN